MKGLLSMKHLLKCRQWCCCHCSVYLWESRASSEIKSRQKRRETSFGVRWCSAPACCMSSQVFTPSLSHLAFTDFPGGTEPCPVWGEQTLVPATGTAEDPQGHVRTIAASQHQTSLRDQISYPFISNGRRAQCPHRNWAQTIHSPAEPSPALSPVLFTPSPNYSCTCSCTERADWVTDLG